MNIINPPLLKYKELFIVGSFLFSYIYILNTRSAFLLNVYIAYNPKMSMLVSMIKASIFNLSCGGQLNTPLGYIYLNGICKSS